MCFLFMHAIFVLISPPSACTDVPVDVKKPNTKSKRTPAKKRSPRKAGSPSMQSKIDVIGEEASLQTPAKIKVMVFDKG